VPHPRQLILTADEIRRAIFVDYEGSKDKPPTLIGYMIDNEIRAAIIERCFDNCKKWWKAKHAVPADHKEIVMRLLHRSSRENRVLVSWSEHDYKLMCAVLGTDPEEKCPRTDREEVRPRFIPLRSCRIHADVPSQDADHPRSGEGLRTALASVPGIVRNGADPPSATLAMLMGRRSPMSISRRSR
jgi:hypothetical protein